MGYEVVEMEEKVLEDQNKIENGQGTYTYPNGEKYEGEFKDDKPNGQGTLTFPDGEKYVGKFKDGKQHGQGTLTTTDGQKYVGGWKDGVQRRRPLSEKQKQFSFNLCLTC